VGNVSPDDAGYYFRMVDVDFSPRRIYTAIQEKTHEPEKEPSDPFSLVPVLLLALACGGVGWLLVRSLTANVGRRRR
jgi:hypothetical protein